MPFENISNGSEHISTTSRIAASGGYTTILQMPDSEPRADNSAAIQYIQDRINKYSCIKVLLCGCLTQGSKGEELAPLGSLKENGIVALSDCPFTPQNNQIFSKGVEYASMFELPVIDLARDLTLSKNGNAHDGPLALKLGLGGFPRIAEELFVQRAISVAKSLNTHIHLSSISSFGSVELIRDAKTRKIKISADVTPHHISLNETSISKFNSNFKTTPPLREEVDRKALIEGLRDGTIDSISSAHEPYQTHEKNVEFDLAPPGVVGLETAFSVSYENLILKNKFTWKKLINMMSCFPSKLLKQDSGNLSIGQSVDLAVFDPKLKWNYTDNTKLTPQENSPFKNTNFKGKIIKTFVNGKEIYSI